ncbi:MAG: ATP-binding cassette domain-containing protein [Bacilli bacterium]|nr:ATP-binding cassette domain-containing protein [Bacilli bacterium]
MSAILVTKNLTKRYGDKVVLDRVNLDVQEGDILGLVGKNGAGKTTLIRVLTDVARPSDGNYSIFGVEDQHQLIPLRRNIAAMVESPAYYDSLTAEMNIINRCIIMEQKGDYGKIAEDMLRFVGLSEVIGTGKKAKDFSLGMRQRLGIAMALSGEPEL